MKKKLTKEDYKKQLAIKQRAKCDKRNEKTDFDMLDFEASETKGFGFDPLLMGMLLPTLLRARSRRTN